MVTNFSKMKKGQPVLLILVLFCICSISRGQDIRSRLDSVAGAYAKSQSFSGAVLVAKGGEVLLSKGYGLADRETGRRNMADTPFLIGSTTKSFTAVAAMQLREKGMLDFHLPISHYLDGLSEDLGKVTIHQLLKMSSGLKGHLGQVTELKYEEISSAEMVKLINLSGLQFEPGSAYQYSNLNYQLVACIVEKVAGKRYSQVLAESTFEPLGMGSSGNESASYIIQNKARGYQVDDSGELKPAERNYMSYALGSGDVYSTVEDLYRWDRGLTSGTYLDKKSIELLYDGQPEVYDGYGYGFKIREYQREQGQGKLVRHGGSMRGYLANYHHYLEDDITVIVLSNVRPFPIIDLTFDLKEIVLGRDPGKEGKAWSY